MRITSKPHLKEQQSSLLSEKWKEKETEKHKIKGKKTTSQTSKIREKTIVVNMDLKEKGHHHSKHP